MNPLFTIITVCYNSAKTISHTFDSIIAQSYKDFEYIVIDGTSNDGTIEIIEGYETKFSNAGINFFWLSEPDEGIYDAMNKGIKRSAGQFIGILNSDDVYMPLALEKVKSTVENNPGYNVYHGLLRHTNNGILTQITGTSSDRLTKGMIEHPACFVTKNTYNKYGLFDCAYKYVADYDFMIRVKLNSGKFFMIEEILAQFDENGRGNSYKSNKEFVSLRKKYNFISTTESILLRLKIYLSIQKKNITLYDSLNLKHNIYRKLCIISKSAT